jgi:hypothetical protein
MVCRLEEQCGCICEDGAMRVSEEAPGVAMMCVVGVVDQIVDGA